MPVPDHQDDAGRRPAQGPLRRRGAIGLAAAGLLLLGGAAGAVVVAESRPAVTLAPTIAVPIRALSAGGIVTIRGRVAEIYGNKLIVADASGRALVDLGPEGDERALVTPGEPVMVQGRFDRGFIHAAFLVGPDQKVLALGPLAGPPHGPPGPHGPHGRRGPDGGPDAPPPPPPPPGPDRAADAPPPAPATAAQAPAVAPNAATPAS